MNLCEELVMKSNDAESRRKEVREEIKNDFAEYITSGKLEEYLRSSIAENEIGRRSFTIGIVFHTYDKFKPASFLCGGYVWTPPGAMRHDSNKYKGIWLSDINEDVCFDMCRLLERGLMDLGFSHIKYSGAKANPYYVNRMTIEW